MFAQCPMANGKRVEPTRNPWQEGRYLEGQKEAKSGKVEAWAPALFRLPLLER